MHPDETVETLVILGTDDETELEALAVSAQALNIRHAVFVEPDLGNSKTAIAIGPEGRCLAKRLPLAFREKAKAA
jgi:hypothetical protein